MERLFEWIAARCDKKTQNRWHDKDRYYPLYADTKEALAINSDDELTTLLLPLQREQVVKQIEKGQFFEIDPDAGMFWDHYRAAKPE